MKGLHGSAEKCKKFPPLDFYCDPNQALAVMKLLPFQSMHPHYKFQGQSRFSSPFIRWVLTADFSSIKADTTNLAQHRTFSTTLLL